MSTDHRAKLAGIRQVDQLVAYLRDEMDWPIAQDSFEDEDDLFFDFTAEEVGIDSASAAKIRAIRRLRPLSLQQPWGIFFVEFEPKRLPVVALRRILSRVALKKRASANPDHAAWSADDLLFVSSYGEGDGRQISFAHFTQHDDKNDLPTLKVLGWDNRDTPLHLDNVADILRERLAWPAEEDDIEAWRREWRSAFTLGHREVITTSKMLSVELAHLARNIRDRLNTVLEIETADGPVTKLMGAFKGALVHDLEPDDFADMYAQTLAYGLLSARIGGPSRGTADDVVTAMPVTNPFLAELMEAFLDVGGRKAVAGGSPGLDFDELGVSEIVGLLDDANMEAVVRDFGDRNPQEDPVIHFYELFLTEYDAAKRMQRGVFYTPRPLVSSIVLSVDELLRSEFGLELGLADPSTWAEVVSRLGDLPIPQGAAADEPFVQILDPATGTGTFLVEVIEIIHKTMTEMWCNEGHGADRIRELWNDYVPSQLLPRLHGYELMMAPYVIAHMKVGLKLVETGYQFESDQRARIYLANALEAPKDFSGQLAFALPALAHEVEAVNTVKRDRTFTVILGNPPYAKSSANRFPEAEALVQPFKDAVKGEKNVQPLSDDYVKFIGLALRLQQQTPGVIGMVTNRSFLGGLIHRGMREQLLKQYPDCHFLDLHGDTNVGEDVPSGCANENVFDITQGVAISLLCRTTMPQATSVKHIDLWGTRSEKFAAIGSGLTSVPFTSRDPHEPYWFVGEWTLVREDSWVGLDELFVVKGMGLKSRRDHFLIAADPRELHQRLERLLSSADIESSRELLGVSDNDQWTLAGFRDLVVDEGIDARIYPIEYRPFDRRYIWYHPRAIERGDARWPVMRHVLDGQLSLLTSRQSVSGAFSAALVARGLSEMKAAESSRGSYVFPLYRVPADGEMVPDRHEMEPNFRATLLSGSLQRLGPEQLLSYIYAILYSNSYRLRYSSSLRVEFPRIPSTCPVALSEKLAELGAGLIQLHLLEASVTEASIEVFGFDVDRTIQTVAYSGGTVWVDKDRSRGFRGIAEDVWEYEIGGYRVCERWLKERQPRDGKRPRPIRALEGADIARFRAIVSAVAGSIRIGHEIDDLVESCGGWPGAFETDSPVGL